MPAMIRFIVGLLACFLLASQMQTETRNAHGNALPSSAAFQQNK